ncbi:MAG: hypothetical protein P1Q69_10380 [Candidatus Thorarchaeota archaeon]|nr:hypothetical protein [Candidatus Thorarchaeota archaeon]
MARLIAQIRKILDNDEYGGLYDTLEHLNQIFSQMFSDYKYKTFISTRYSQIMGDHLHLLLDIVGEPLASLEGKISKISGHVGGGGIENPRFPEGQELEELFARIIAIVISDGHLRPNGIIEYSEPDMERIRTMENYLQAFGDIRLNPGYIEKGRYYITPISNVLGNALIHLGLTTGDKTIQNSDLFSSFLNISWRALCAFFEELIPQDGSVTPISISCTHTLALHPGDKEGAFGSSPLIGNAEVEFIKGHGKPGKKNAVLTVSTLVDLTKSEDPDEARIARKLLKTILDNPNKFIKFEKRMADKIGVKTNTVPYTIRYHYKSGRVSVAWYITTAGVYHAIKMAMIAPSNDIKRRQIMRDAIRKRPKLVKKILEELKSVGIHINKWWIQKQE